MDTFQPNLQQLMVSDDTHSASHKQSTQNDGWVSFEQMLQRLHKEGIYVHADQLAEFLLFHGLPVHLRYVPTHLRQKAIQINRNYQGDMVQLTEELDEPY